MGEHKRTFRGTSTLPRVSTVKMEEVRACLPASEPTECSHSELWLFIGHTEARGGRKAAVKVVGQHRS